MPNNAFGLDPEQIYRVLSDFWKDYEQRDQLATMWGGFAQVMDNEYLQLYQSDFSKALATVPLYWRYQWVNLVLDSWISNEVIHEHHWYEKTTTFVAERSTGQLVEGTGYTELVDTTVDFTAEGIGTGHVLLMAGSEYRATNVSGNTIRIAEVLPAAANVTYEIRERYFDLMGDTSAALGSCHATHPTDDNIFETEAGSLTPTVALPWIYTRGVGELSVYRNDILQTIDEDFTEATNQSISFIPALTTGESVRVEKAPKARIVSIMLNGVYLTWVVDYEFSDTFEIKLVEALTARVTDGLGHNIMVHWQDITTPVAHSHRQFQETLAAPKDTWTDAVGDAFEPEPDGQGPYQFGDDEAPIEVWTNGAKQVRALQSEPNSVTLTIAAPAGVGDEIFIRWIRTDANVENHKHLRYTNVLGTASPTFTVPFVIDTRSHLKHIVYVNGVIQTMGLNYQVVGQNSNVLSFDEDLVPGDIVEVEYYVREYLYRHIIDPTIYAAPIIQDGIDMPSIISIDGVTHEVRDGWLYCDFDLDEIWIPNLFVNEPTTENNFGAPIGFARPNNIDYLNAVKALWYCYWNGPAFQLIEDGSKILLDVPFSPTATRVTKREELSGSEDVHLEAQDGTQYNVQAPLVPTVNAGEDVRAFQPLATGVEVWDYVTNPEWYKQFPHLYQLWDQFSVSGEPFVGFWDDRGYLDDGGFWDDAGTGDPAELERLNKALFDLIKWFVFIVNADASLLTSEDRLDDLIFYLDTIKPAYTKYFILATLPGTEDTVSRRATDSVSFEMELIIDEVCRDRWDDDGNMDISVDGTHFLTVLPGQQDLDIPFPYRLGDNTLRIEVNGVLQVLGVDYQEVTAVQAHFFSAFAGGEGIRVYQDDSLYLPMDRGVAMDLVSLV